VGQYSELAFAEQHWDENFYPYDSKLRPPYPDGGDDQYVEGASIIPSDNPNDLDPNDYAEAVRILQLWLRGKKCYPFFVSKAAQTALKKYFQGGFADLVPACVTAKIVQEDEVTSRSCR
jgi:hypothetical protein